MKKRAIGHVEILDKIAPHKSGISFNKLAEELKGYISRSLLSREVKKLCNMGYIESRRDVTHRQRIIFTLNKDLTLLINKTKLNPPSGRLTKRKASRIILKYISVYNDFAKQTDSQFLQDYLKHRITKIFLSLLDIMK